MFEREVADITNGIRRLKNNQGNAAACVLGRVAAGGLVIGGRLHPYTLAVDIDCDVGDTVYAIMSGNTAVVVGK